MERFKPYSTFVPGVILEYLRNINDTTKILTVGILWEERRSRATGSNQFWLLSCTYSDLILLKHSSCLLPGYPACGIYKIDNNRYQPTDWHWNWRPINDRVSCDIWLIDYRFSSAITYFIDNWWQSIRLKNVYVWLSIGYRLAYQLTNLIDWHRSINWISDDRLSLI